MSAAPLDELYLNWLYQVVHEKEERELRLSHWHLFKLLYQKEFVWIIPNDDNRVEDGRDLRVAFVHQLGVRGVDRNWMELGCSFLEMLIGLAGRLEFEASGTAEQWFWHLLKTLDLFQYNDSVPIPLEDVDDILNTVIHRQYRHDGVGGLFPLRHPHQDQRKVEIWYQLNAYLMENDA